MMKAESFSALNSVERVHDLTTPSLLLPYSGYKQKGVAFDQEPVVEI